MDKIVIIEDDPGIRTVLRLALKGAGFTDVIAEERSDKGLEIVLREHPALVILDLMLPGMDGLAVCREIRRTPAVAATPIVMLSAKSTEEDIVRGLELGADDYVTKPFSKAVLIARVRAALRRPTSTRGAALAADLYRPKDQTGPFAAIAVSGLVLDEATRSATIGAAPLVLTRSEFDLLKTLVSHPGRVYSRSMILDAIQNEDKDVTDRTVDTLMVGLRRKLGAWAAHVETIRGVGYRLTP